MFTFNWINLIVFCIFILLLVPMETTVSEESSKPESGDWHISRSKSEMDDSKTIFVYLEAANEIEDLLKKTHRPTLVIRCLENKTEVIVHTEVTANPELGLYNEYSVRIRFDSGKPIKQRWSGSTNNEALFAPQPIKLAKQINNSEKMLFEFVPFQMGPQIVEFNVKGLESYLNEIAEACNWKL